MCKHGDLRCKFSFNVIALPSSKVISSCVNVFWSSNIGSYVMSPIKGSLKVFFFFFLRYLFDARSDFDPFQQ
ncbi:hypothetical protein GDO81_017792 [Engystomops pustulosus]|uniref:Uncharacterized protein n=1 Tax=Engystomops pustulosus TaxID=76066 RepID=A0AAV7A8U4_ENGPU|nr:hypothetical protein GDO81_017792 [Engystomops pustulosus]